MLDGVLGDPAWQRPSSVVLDHDYAGEPAGPQTSARFSWRPEALYFAFDCAYDTLFVFADAPTDEELARLYTRDALELFIDVDPSTPETYLELEVSPLGQTLDIEVDRTRRPRGRVAMKLAGALPQDNLAFLIATAMVLVAVLVTTSGPRPARIRWRQGRGVKCYALVGFRAAQEFSCPFVRLLSCSPPFFFF